MLAKKRKNKTGVSLMLSYVLLISIALGISATIYVWLKDFPNVVNPKINCKDGTSIFLENYNCPLDGTIHLDLKNNGYFGIDGFIVHVSNNPKREPTDGLTPIEDTTRSIYYFREEGEEMLELPYSLVSKWKFEDGFDDSGSENDGTFSGDSNFVKSNIFGLALTFNGSGDTISVSEDSSLDLQNELTITAMFNSLTATNQIIVAKEDVSGDPAYIMDIQGNALRCYGYDGGTQIGISTPTGTSVVNNGWHFGVCTFNGTDWTIYVDDLETPYKEHTEAGTLNDADDGLTIGNFENGASNRYFEGEIAEVAIYDEALTTDQIKTIYNYEKRLSPGETITDIRFYMNLNEDIEIIKIQPFILDEAGSRIVCEDAVIKQNLNCEYS